jgi:hypothetical protein
MKHVHCLLVAGLALIAASAFAAKPIRGEDFDHLSKLIKPGKAEEPWATIPWLTDLWRARQLAAKEGKPILLWEMDGHPLGCT